MALPIPYNTRSRARNTRADNDNFTLLTSGAHREGAHTREGQASLVQNEEIITESSTDISTEAATIRSQSQPSDSNMTNPERKRMPLLGERRAPSFNGESEELPRFFDAVEIAAEEVGLGDREKMVWACRYVKKLTDEETWRTADAL